MCLALVSIHLQKNVQHGRNRNRKQCDSTMISTVTVELKKFNLINLYLA